MVDLAKQAFDTNNFELAADIYERTITENGPTSTLYLGLADSLARGKQFSKAFEAYSNALRLGSISPEKLKHLVEGLIQTVRQESSESSNMMNKNCIFTCMICRGLLNDPVTIPCGHTFCRKCLDKDQNKICRKCGNAHYFLKLYNIKTNVLMNKLLEKWFPNECKAVKLKSDGNRSFEIHKFDKAIESYSEAIELAPNDHLLMSNRSHAYASIDCYKEALYDAENAIKLRPDWPKGYFRKGCALYGLNQYEDAVVAFLQCLALDTSVVSAKTYLSKGLHKLLSQLPPSNPKAVALQNRMNPSTLQRLIESNFSSTLLLPQVSVESLVQLKGIIRDTINTASQFSADAKEPVPELQYKRELTTLNEEVPTSDEAQQSTSKCQSAPNSRTGSPVFMEDNGTRSRTQSPCRHEQENRKRQRQKSGSTPTSPTTESPFKLQKSAASLYWDAPNITNSLLNRDDFDCSLCYRLLYLPVTTPCGHTFCRPCLDRCLDHQSQCPLCKSSLAEYLAERRQAITESVQGVVEVYFPEDREQRKVQHEEEMTELSRMLSNNQHEIPVFVCAMAYPGISCPLHIFEPRYRLMVRQCMESGIRQFGMCVKNGENDEDFSDFGTMLEIRDVQFFPDGRSLVDTIGGRRFKVVSRGRRDGYNTARVEFIEDTTVPLDQLQEVHDLHNEVYSMCKNWFDSLPGMQREQVMRHLGNYPEMEDFQNNPNGPKWLWWLLPVLPLDPRIQMTMLAMASFKERLEGIRRVVQFITRRRDQ